MSDELSHKPPSDKASLTNPTITKKIIKKLVSYYVAPHHTVSREVFEDDLPTIDKDGDIMYKLLFCRVGNHPGAHAIAHPQIEDKHPLRFFVTPVAIIINPKILNWREPTMTKREGCMSFPNEPLTMVKRLNKIKVSFQTIIQKPDGSFGLSEILERDVKGLEAEVWQHEIDHLNGKYIYEK